VCDREILTNQLSIDMTGGLNAQDTPGSTTAKYLVTAQSMSTLPMMEVIDCYMYIRFLGKVNIVIVRLTSAYFGPIVIKSSQCHHGPIMASINNRK
jgi:hypothetical protein